ncbi:Hypothetical_protein [Hexamita inflata]|uniref:Hypothetical_protein n=1 Tax=Hexamita inflata TaxID=28002 RepID=A0AA86QLR3_9EUKA|nr:Hypothetical protein HINF_LOCUS13834 [Hexamita inflata]CAI9958852.1 Hypothetical protein HINF_LOCUS46497 [Hexamita inflata]
MEKWNMQEINMLKNTFNQFPRPLTYESKSAENYQNMQWAYICKFKSQIRETRFYQPSTFPDKFENFTHLFHLKYLTLCIYNDSRRTLHFSPLAHMYALNIHHD